eukprot:CAMPEP_0184496198 /NCGR_PEP_ID=MMETSP0113_2-20130426/33338_1 /TAXON_ID=91329 /ORGANISM="Norrisiella sphaerica, Strain BC52" /LENGTH=608 /DNA_ID=CAMNT_0026882717 /DNA_START=267 /DNA_END=2093 /DNA_ORIENTATION=+
MNNNAATPQKAVPGTATQAVEKEAEKEAEKEGEKEGGQPQERQPLGLRSKLKEKEAKKSKEKEAKKSSEKGDTPDAETQKSKVEAEKTKGTPNPDSEKKARAGEGLSAANDAKKSGTGDGSAANTDGQTESSEPVKQRIPVKVFSKEELKASKGEGDPRRNNHKNEDTQSETEGGDDEEEEIEYDENMDYYKVLGVDKDSNESQIKKAYRAKALKYHPDRNSPEKKAMVEKRFRQVAEAYQVLSDPEERKKYDRSRNPAKYKKGVDEQEFDGFQDPMDIFREMMQDHHIPGPMGQMIGEILQNMGGSGHVIFDDAEGPFEGRTGGRLKNKNIRITMMGPGGPGPFGFPPGFGPPPGLFGGFPQGMMPPGMMMMGDDHAPDNEQSGGPPGGKRTVMHMERVMRDKDGRVFKVVEEKVLGPGELPPGMDQIAKMLSSQKDPMTALKQLQKLNELQQKQADEAATMLFLLVFVSILMGAYRRQMAVAKEMEARRAEAIQMRRLQESSEGKNMKIQDRRPPHRERPVMYNPAKSNTSTTNNGGPHVSGTRSTTSLRHDKNNTNTAADALNLGSAVTRRRVEEGINAVAKTASGVKQRVMASYRSAVKRGKKD